LFTEPSLVHMQPPIDIPDHELLRLIGRGAYGEVWLARNVMGVMRSVKVVRRASFESLRPFEREFSAVRRYEPVSRKTSGLVNVLHAGRAADGSHFHYVMELADCATPGVDAASEPDAYVPCTLRLVIGRMGRMPVGDCLEIAVSLANGMADLHRVGLVHRDVKPSNIIFVDGRAKLADIGLVGDSSESRSYVGTEGYVPPEGPGQPGADLYALGRVLYEMATGYEASRFPALPPEWAAQQDHSAFEFYEVVLRCCEPHISRRYRTTEELLADLALLHSGQSVRQVRQMKGRISLLKKVAAIAIALGSLAFILAWWQGREAEAQRKLVTRAEKAEAEAQQNLFVGLVQQAHNARRSGDPDARFIALELLERAAKLYPGDPAVREEMVSALAIPGLKLISTTSAEQHFPVYNWDQGAICARELGRQLMAGKFISLTHKIEGAKWLHAITHDPVTNRVFARDNLSRLHTWKDDVLEPALMAAGSGACQWTVTPSGKLVLAWRDDGTVTVFNPEVPAERHEWKCRSGFAAGLGAVPSFDSQSVAYCSTGGTSIALHNLPAGELRVVLKSPRRLSGALDVSEDASVIAAGFEDGGIGIWRTTGSQVCEVIEAGQSFINSLAISPDGRHLVTTSWAGLTHLWDLATGARITRVTLPNSVPSFSADGRQLALCGLSGDFLYQFERGERISVVLPRNEIVSRKGIANRFQIHPTAPLLALPMGGQIMLVNTTKASTQSALLIQSTDATFSADGQFLFAGETDILRIPCNKSGQTGMPTIFKANPAGTPYSQLRSTADGLLVTGWSRDGSWHYLSENNPTVISPMAADTSEYCSLHPTGKWLAHGYRHGGVTVRNVADGSKVNDIVASGQWSSCTFSPDGKSLAVGDASGMRLFATDNWQQLWHNPNCGKIELTRNQWFTADSRWLMRSAQPGTIGIYDSQTGQPAIHLISDHETPAAHLGMGQDGTLWELYTPTHTLWRWNLKHIRAYLRSHNLDWAD
jgi:serine/threonine protein kinase/WD40 repeat protein